MKKYFLLLSAVVLVLSNGVPAQSQTSLFDGSWNVQIKCEETFNSPAYNYKFVAQVKDGLIAGQYGEEGKPNSLKITGKIEPDGSSLIEAAGHVGKASGKTVAGQAYNYVIKAEFKGSQGKGVRMQTVRSGLRNCDYLFTKQ